MNRNPSNDTALTEDEWASLLANYDTWRTEHPDEYEQLLAKHMEQDAAQPPHDHGTIGEAGQCAHCRAYAIEALANCPHGWVLAFGEPGHQTVTSIVLVHDWKDPVEAAWATGCNPDGWVAEIGPIPADRLARTGVAHYEILEGGAAHSARLALRLAGIEVPEHVDFGGHRCHHCGDPISGHDH